ncbi:DUF3575 domain-containing protein [Rhodocytophaga aerolata]|uniref:DUF3575 domain-containing protein n=1 Tax=Rhodocytophaga aerolata TaxID=455078 RepID=A0ABT8RJ65_9BACT|nr:DUF3575 domain-containing protein [Rhodocytophaga aerolata]MDO1451811.1 DUF3575 domain-containing protein [Rhodocytophaga aerolata]
MNRKSIFLLAIGILLMSKSYAQIDSLPVRNNIKLKIPTGGYKHFFSEFTLVGLQYERLLTSKNSISLSAHFSNSAKDRTTVEGTIQHYKQVMLLPQWRHYLRKNKQNYFNGFYVGFSTAYMRDYIYRIDNTEKRHLIGAGALIGYQQVIKKKLSIGFTPSLHYGANFSTTNSTVRQERKTEGSLIYLLDFHIGYIF